MFCYQKVARIDCVTSLLQPLGKAHTELALFSPFRIPEVTCLP